MRTRPTHTYLRWCAASAVLLAALSASAVAQARLGVAVSVAPVAPLPPGSSTAPVPPPPAGPEITILNAFADQRSTELLASGFAATVTVTVELWADRRLFDDLLGATTVRRLIRFDALAQVYRIGRVESASIVEEARVSSLSEVRAHLSAPLQVVLPAPRGRRDLYYTAHLTIETLNRDDLLELQRWLQGEVRPAMRGEKSPGSPITRGLGTLFSRLLGGDVKRVQGRSGLFGT